MFGNDKLGYERNFLLGLGGELMENPRDTEYQHFFFKRKRTYIWFGDKE